MRTRRIIGWIAMIPAFVFWLLAIGSASSAGFSADAYAFQIMVMGGAISTVAALLLNIDVLDL